MIRPGERAGDVDDHRRTPRRLRGGVASHSRRDPRGPPPPAGGARALWVAGPLRGFCPRHSRSLKHDEAVGRGPEFSPGGGMDLGKVSPESVDAEGWRGIRWRGGPRLCRTVARIRVWCSAGLPVFPAGLRRGFSRVRVVEIAGCGKACEGNRSGMD